MNRKTLATILLLTVMGMGCCLGAFAYSPTLDDEDEYWLARYIGKEVVLVLVEAQPLLGRGIKAKLRHVEQAGIVVEWNKKYKFYSYGNLISVAPADQVKWGALVEALTGDR